MSRGFVREYSHRMMALVLYYLIGSLAVFAAGVLVYWWSLRWTRPISWKVFFVASLIGATSLLVLPVLKFHALGMYVDFSHWLGVLMSIRETGLPLSLSHEFIRPGTLNYFSVHFTPLVYVIALPFALIPWPEMLLMVSVLFMISSAVPLFLLAKKLTGRLWIAWLCVPLLLWYPTFQYITLYEFEMLRFSIPILLWALYFFEAKKTAWFFLFVVLASLVREEVGLTVAALGVFLFIVERARWKGIATMVIGMGTFAVITSLVMPELRQGEYAYIAAPFFSTFGDSPLHMLQTIVSRPIWVMMEMFQVTKVANIGMLFIPLLGLSFFSPTALIGMAANLGVGFVSIADVHTSYMLYYVSPSVPFVFYAVLRGWNKAHVWIRARMGKCATEEQGESALGTALIAGMFVSAIVFGPSPLSLQFWAKDVRPAPFRTQNFHISAYDVNDHHRAVATFIRMIPDDAVVSSPQFLHPHLYQKRAAMVFPDTVSKDGTVLADYVLLDLTNNSLRADSPAYVSMDEMRLVAQNDAWRLITKSEGYELYVRVPNLP